jgi:hypothetical protein
MQYDYALFISMMSLLCLFLPSLKVHLLLLFPLLGQVDIAVVEK